jgi:peptidoglycan/xylan/chitin deacetylase (PgdA/CDA1 family)
MSKTAELTKSLLQAWLMRGSFYWRLPGSVSTALTFDDGPDPEHTPRVLETLAHHGIKATFFVIGDRARQSPQLLREIIQAGHMIGSHTQTHREFPDSNAQELARELEQARQTIEDVGGVAVSLVRPPRGRLDVKSLYRVPAFGYRIVHWSVTYGDYLRDGPEKLIGRMRSRQPQPKDIVLLHDNLADTAAVLPAIVQEWLAQGRVFTALDAATLGIA